MNSQIIGLRVAGTIFGLMGLAQLSRLIIRPEILVVGYQFPLWPSAVAVQTSCYVELNITGNLQL